MRKMSAGNKKVFTIFTLVVIGIITVFLIGLSSVLAIEKESYNIAENTILFDKECKAIELKKQATLYKKWDGNFYLKEEEQETLIGKQAITYIPNRNRVCIYGDTFEVNKGGNVTKFSQRNELEDMTKDTFFKLEDRKYLLIGENIQNETGSIKVKGYLIVRLDKTGNTLLSNHELNMKTLKPMVLKTTLYEFDVANEKLKIETEVIDLKKIIGSSNQYQEVKRRENKTNEDTSKEDENVNVTQIEGMNPEQTNQDNPMQGSDSEDLEEQEEEKKPSTQNLQNQMQGNQTVIQQGTNGQNTNNAQIGGNISNNGKDEDKNEKEENKTPLAKNINLRGITPRSSTLDVQYAILDPENRYQTIYLDIQGDIQKTIALDKTQRNYLVTGLTPNTEYKVTVAYKEILEDNTIADGIEDTMIVRTSKILDTITINKIANNKLYFTYQMDKNYVYESGKIVLYVDGEKQEEMDIDIASSITTNGWQTSVIYPYGNEIVLKLENAIYEGKTVNRQLQAKLRRY